MSEENLSQLISLGSKIKSFAKVKGKKFIVIGNSNSHNYPLHTILTFTKENASHSISDAALEVPHRNSLNVKDVVILESNESLKFELEIKKQELKEAEKTIELSEKLDINVFQLVKFRKLIDVLTKYNLEKDSKFLKEVLKSLE